MQDEIVARLANQLGTQLIAAEARRAAHAPHPNSLDLYFQGMVWLNKGLTPEYVTKASGLFERALVLDPDNVDALVGAAYVSQLRAIIYLADDRATLLATAEATLTKALLLAPAHALAHMRLGSVQINTNRAAQGYFRMRASVGTRSKFG